ncbi:DJ-1/PfpI family protein [Ferrimonas futtsuensis]|uniref:DJ-1/PfpI family protein n=1 Tax=Ferrimonas futtsuensis TaxID=364764 RepID=UPI00042875DD|nr:DJ-1/PfpI family protein [Ferrimonas futtsuensis]
MNRRQFISAGLAVATSASLPLYASADHRQFRVIALVFDDFETLDLHGPVEMLGHMEGCTIELVGARSITRSYQGPKVVSDLAMDNVHPCDLFLIPGGVGTRKLVKDKTLLTWIAQQCQVSAKVFTVCTGSALLASTPLLDGVSATTNKQAYAWVTHLNPRVNWQPRARWVNQGKYITSSGVSAGTDAALELVRLYRGEKEARRIAALAEYQWNSDADNDPFAVEISPL